MSNVTAIAPRPLAAGGKLSAIVPKDMEEAYRLAKAICVAGMAPRGMDSPEKCMISIMRGMEVGLTPMMALDKIAIVNGRPVIWGDGAMGLVRGSGVCEWVKEYMEGEGDNRAGVCIAKRRGEPEPIERRFSVAEAKKANLWGKSGPWQQFPDRMLQMRARAFCLRDLFADVLGGLYLREEIEDDNPRAITHPVHAEPEAIAYQSEPESDNIAPEELSALENLIAITESNTAAFCKYLKIENLADLPSDQYERAMFALEEKLKRTNPEKFAELYPENGEVAQ
jgi:hypothetical protein